MFVNNSSVPLMIRFPVDYNVLLCDAPNVSDTIVVWTKLTKPTLHVGLLPPNLALMPWNVYD